MPDNEAFTDKPQIPDWALLATVFITGACVLIIELMGTRILAPYFGSGIYTWSALIAITLAALALGYSFGGRLADRLPRALTSPDCGDETERNRGRRQPNARRQG